MLRKRRAELMDDPNLDPLLHYEALEGLAQLNKFSFAGGSLWQQLKEFYKHSQMSKIRVLDLACGGGDIAISLAKRARNSGLNFEIVGADISSTAIDFARKKASGESLPLSFLELDVMNNSIPNDFDILIASLFTHHLDPPEVIHLFSKMAAATKHIVLINDLIRNKFSFSVVSIASKIFSTSPIVHHDGQASVEAAFTIDEMRKMAYKAGLNECVVKHCFPCRQLLIWRKAI